MNCPICSSETRVLAKEGDVRRRECTKCKARFRTREVLKVEHDKLQEAVQEVRALAERLAA